MAETRDEAAASVPTDAEVLDAMAQLAYFHPRVGGVHLYIAGTHVNYLAVRAGDWIFNLHSDEDRVTFVEWARIVRNEDNTAQPPTGSSGTEEAPNE